MVFRNKSASTEQLEKRVDDLRARVASLEGELHLLRQHHQRTAELTDVVQELLIPVAQRDEAAVAEAIEKFNRSL
ncbi:DUF6752 domain-containing protein [Nocardioides sp. CFH 31398]|uniref:DUF6752 domain-containing protein n=1 Tax=Nocardioides sp. CFH 31398 TaxID=2919579 RepID=UPI001F06005E|nr:DUF6752 domain-containing protein [Nocardioides sp. CFH 31398]MCH1866469.1 hypothetical protein [Nocardioides sp. CFH 31398]